MKNNVLFIAFISVFMLFSACNNETATSSSSTSTTADNKGGTGQSGVKDDVSERNVVQVAVGSKDHTTLVTAVKAAELVDALSNAGPFTVFAPTNAAFDKLPKGTVEGLLKADKKADLQTVLQYHVYVGSLSKESFTDGQSLGMVDGGNVTMHVKDGKLMVNDANIVASVKAANGWVHVIDAVLLPKK